MIRPPRKNLWERIKASKEASADRKNRLERITASQKDLINRRNLREMIRTSQQDLINRRNKLRGISVPSDVLRYAYQHNFIGIIQDVVCEIWDVSLSQLLSDSREAPIVKARKSAMLLARCYELGTTTEIGARFNRDHTTVSVDVQSARSMLQDAEKTDREHTTNKLSIFKKRFYLAKTILDEHFNPREVDYQI